MNRRILLALLFTLLAISCSNTEQRPVTTLDTLRANHSPQAIAAVFAARQKERADLVAFLKSSSGHEPVTDSRVLAAIGHVPRHAFVDLPHLVERAYLNRSMPIGYGQTISNPVDVATMMQLLDVQPDDRVLEIGTGSGYQAALLSELSKHVFTIEIVKPLEQQSDERFHLLGYDSIQHRLGDGYYGWQEQAPFQKIIVTCAAGHIPPPLLQQLAAGGRMVIPVGDPYGVQRLIVVMKDDSGEVRTEDRYSVRFVPMTGSGASSQ